MASDRGRSCGIDLLRPVVVAAGICLAVGGCGMLPETGARLSDSPRLFPSGIGAKGEAEAFKKQVQDDPFPAAGKDGI